jgi:hypothetical protein
VHEDNSNRIKVSFLDGQIRCDRMIKDISIDNCFDDISVR